jgi:hypothetical protein
VTKTQRELRTLIENRNLIDEFVLVSARKKSRGADHWAKDNYDVRNSHGKVVGALCFSRKHRKISRGFGR